MMLIYQSEDGSVKIDVRLDRETVWLTQAQMCLLFGRERSVISKHIKNIFAEGELSEKSNVQILHITHSDKPVKMYNLDVIISVGYRVKSIQGTRFRQWATQRLKEYIIKGFTLDDERLKGNGGGNYWKELLDRIRDIRSSEKVMYRQVLDLYATAIDYNPRSEESLLFFKVVQNKLHYAAHGNTASEVIYMRVDCDKPFVGLTHFKGDEPTQAEVLVAKNYLDEKELRVLNNLVAAYFDLAELNAIEQREMRMADYVRELDRILQTAGREVLTHAGHYSHEQAKEKAISEYRKYKAKTLSHVERDYLDFLHQLEQKAKEGLRNGRKAP